MRTFIDRYRHAYGVEPICKVATLEWVSWFNHHHLLEPLGYIPPAEAEANYYMQLSSQAILG